MAFLVLILIFFFDFFVKFCLSILYSGWRLLFWSLLHNGIHYITISAKPHIEHIIQIMLTTTSRCAIQGLKTWMPTFFSMSKISFRQHQEMQKLRINSRKDGFYFKRIICDQNLISYHQLRMDCSPDIKFITYKIWFYWHIRDVIAHTHTHYSIKDRNREYKAMRRKSDEKFKFHRTYKHFDTFLHRSTLDSRKFMFFFPSFFIFRRIFFISVSFGKSTTKSEIAVCIFS